MSRRLQFGALLNGSGGHIAGWRYPGARADGQLRLEHYIEVVQALEAGGFAAVFLADVVAIWGQHLDSLSRTGRAEFFEPLTLLSALAAVTRQIGLVATATTSYNEPYHLARKFASLDHLSGGRAGWNVVTSVVPLEAANFSRDAHFGHSERYRRATEFVEVVRGLWDSYADDAMIRDQSGGRYYLPEKQRTLGHQGEFFQVKGPLNISRPPQGHPVLFQAGASPTGLAFAARFGEVLFTAPPDLDSALKYRKELNLLLVQGGRRPDSVRVWPGLSPVIGATPEEAREKLATLQGLIHDDVLRRLVQDNIGDEDFSDLDLDAPLPELSETNRSQSRREGMLHLARQERLTLRELGLRFAAGRTVAGTPEQVADHIGRWFLTGAADGFNVSFPYLPQSATEFVTQVLPILQERGLFDPSYGPTLRDTLGLERPVRSVVPA